MWQRAEYHCCVAEWRVIAFHEPYLPSGDARLLSGLRIRRSEGQVEGGMLENQATQLSARIAAGPKDTYREFMHS